jgi:OOP family OmpA-OmpF porin
MVSKYLKMLAFITMGGLLACAAPQVQKAETDFQPYDLSSELKDGYYIQKVQTFMIIMDASTSMGREYVYDKKIDVAKKIVSRMNQTIPEGLELTAGFRKFIKKLWPLETDTVMEAPIAAYSREGIENAIWPVKISGASFLDKALRDASEDLQGARGNIAVIVLSDGEDVGDPLKEVKAMKVGYADRLCIHTILVGNDDGGSLTLAQIADASGCGIKVNGDDIMSGEGMAKFVAQVFLHRDSDRDGVPDDVDECPDTAYGIMVDERGCPADSDGDGVTDDIDICPNTPNGVAVDKLGCPFDSDGDRVDDWMDMCPDTPMGVAVNAAGCPPDGDMDGVYDYMDDCPDTPVGVMVNERGCPLTTASMVYFDFDKWDIKSAYYRTLDDFAAYLKDNPDARAEIAGHTDSSGTESYNMGLSERRANAVKQYLLRKGVDGYRVTTVGYGYSRPMGSNQTSAGRAQNRRGELRASE